MSCITRVARAWFISCFALAMAACSGSGGSSSTPLLPWGRLRGGVGNPGVGSGALVNNLGVTTVRLPLGPTVTMPGTDGTPVAVGGLTGSTPIISVNDLIYLGTSAGILVTSTDGTDIRVFNRCTFLDQTIPVAAVDGTAAININDDVVFSDVTGRIFAFHDDGRTFECLWASPAPGVAPPGVNSLSSPLLFSDPVDRTLATTYIGTGRGRLLALNNFGTEQWHFPVDSPGFAGPLSSSPTTDGLIVHISAPDGMLYSLDRGGRLQHQANVSVPMPNTDLLPSPMSTTSTTYATGMGGRCGDSSIGCLAQQECEDSACNELGTVGILTALTPTDDVRWRFATDSPIAGSAAFSLQTIDEPVLPTVSATPVGTRTPTPTPIDNSTLTPTPTQLVLVVQGVIYLVDSEGSVYVVKDASGDLFEIMPTPGTATPTPTPTPTPGEETPTSGSPTPSASPQVRLSKIQLAQPVSVSTSPVVSSDFFVMYGTAGGELYAIRVDFDRSIPCTDCRVSERQWVPIPLANDEFGGGKVPIHLGNAVVSAPVIDRDGTVYVTAGDTTTGVGALYSVGTP